MRFSLFIIASIALSLTLFGCTAQQSAPASSDSESSGPIYDRSTALFHYESFDHEAIDEIPPTPEDSAGGPFVAQWELVGTIEDFDGAGIAKVQVDTTQSSGWILSTVYLDAGTSVEGNRPLTIGDRIECGFLYNSNSEIIKPGSLGYVRILSPE